MVPALCLAWFVYWRWPTPPPPPPPFEPVGLPNLQSLGEGLWSGGTPEGEDAYRSLRRLKVRYIVSVDGSRPDVEGAKKFYLYYIHIPVGYGGIGPEQKLKLARAAAEYDEGIYVHCHHGQHRGPAAAALMRRLHGTGWNQTEATEFLRAAGCDPKYEGLYESVRDPLPISLPGGWPGGPIGGSTRRPVLREVETVGDLTARMVEVDDLWDGLKKAKANGWAAPAGSAHSVAHLAVQLTEQFREAARLPDMAQRPDSFRKKLGNAKQAAAELEESLRTGNAGAAGTAFDRMAAACTACHREHRDRKRP